MAAAQNDTISVYQHGPFRFLTFFTDKSLTLNYPLNCGRDTTQYGNYILQPDSSIKVKGTIKQCTGKFSDDMLVIDGKKWFLKKSYYSKNKVKTVTIFERLWDLDAPSFKKTEYFETGMKKSQGSFRFNKRDGKWKYYSEDGKVIRTEKWVNGFRK
jgi:antitoxin component YwqK of YwqJK toxin-antitoxin module